MSDENIKWDRSLMVEVKLDHEDDFLKIKETLTRIGIPVQKEKTLYQSCHILHKKGKYYIVHFKELFALDGKPATLTTEDINRRNAIIALLVEWGLCSVDDSDMEGVVASAGAGGKIKILKHSEKKDWKLVTKYDIGVKQ